MRQRGRGSGDTQLESAVGSFQLAASNGSSWVLFNPGMRREHVGQVVVWIDAAAAATQNHRVDHSAAPAGIGMADEQPALAAGF